MRLIETDDLGEVGRHRRGKRAGDEVEIVCRYAVHACNFFLWNEVTKILRDSVIERKGEMGVPIDPVHIFEECSTTRKAFKTLFFVQDPAGFPVAVGKVHSPGILQSMFLGFAGITARARAFFGFVTDSKVDTGAAIIKLYLRNVAHGNILSETGEKGNDLLGFVHCCSNLLL